MYEIAAFLSVEPVRYRTARSGVRYGGVLAMFLFLLPRCGVANRERHTTRTKFDPSLSDNEIIISNGSSNLVSISGLRNIRENISSPRKRIDHDSI